MNRRIVVFCVLCALLLSGCAARHPQRVLPLPDPDAERAVRAIPTPTATPTPESSPTAEALPLADAEPEGVDDFAFVGSRLSDKYHDPDCRYAKQIEPENLLGWESIEAAQADGYEPCGVCKPG